MEIQNLSIAFFRLPLVDVFESIFTELVIHKGLLQFLLSIHDKRALLGNRFSNGFAGYQH